MSDDGTTTPPEGTPPGDDATRRADPVEAAADAEEGHGPDVAPECGECHSPLDPEQPYCLVCGAPTPRAPRLRPRGRSAGLWIALALLASAVAAGAVWWGLTRDDGDGPRGGSTVSTGTSPVFPTTATTVITTGGLPPDTTGQVPTGMGTETVTGPVTASTFPTSPVTDPTFPTDETTSSTPTSPEPSTDTTFPDPSTETTFSDPSTETYPTVTDVASDWPGGTSAWTVIIASTTDAGSATTTRDKAEAQGYSPGILKSSEHSGLRPGYFVVYVGQYQSRSAVINRVAQLKSHYPKAYPRYINA